MSAVSGASCTSFAQIGTPTTTSYSDTGLTASTSYSYRIRATDAAGNLSSYSSTASATTSAITAGTITYVQGAYLNPSSSGLVNVTYTSAQLSGDLNVVVVGWSDTVSTVGSITDSKGNTYVSAVGPTTSSGNASQQTYYAKNIAAATAGSNTVTLTFSTTVSYPDVRVVEYSGVDPVNPLDVAIGSAGNGATQNSGSVTTTSANDVLLASNYVSDSTTAVGTGYTQRFITNGGEVVEDKIVSAIGTYSATSTQGGTGWWLMQLAAFRAATGTGDTTPPAAPGIPTLTVASATAINLSWAASTDNVGVTGYRVERCSGASCTTFAQIGTPTTTSYSDTGLTASTSYSYRIRAADAAGNLSSYSSTASATTSAAADTTPPTAPGTPTLTVVSSGQINLSWSASTDNLGVTGYLIQRCQGASCANFALVGASTTASYTDTGLIAATSYSYEVQATDAAGNLSGFSNTVSGTTSVIANTPPPVITSPVSGATVLAGQSLTISANISAGAFPSGVALLAQDPLGSAAIQTVAGSTVTFSITIPPNTPSGPYLITVVGVNSAGAVIPSAQFTVDVEQAVQTSAITTYPGAIFMGSIGDTRSLTVLGSFPGNLQIDISKSSQLTTVSDNSAIATAQNGTITGVASGQTNIEISYGQITTDHSCYRSITDVMKNFCIDRLNLACPGAQGLRVFAGGAP